MDEQNLTCKMVDGIPVLRFPAYFEDRAGKALHQMGSELFHQKHACFIFDFQFCKVLSSRGISSLMNFAMKCLDDYRGKIIMANLDQPKIQVLTLVGAIPLISVADSVEDGLKLLMDDS